MFEQFAIRSLRGVRNLQIEGLKPINLIVGRNNSGKTTLLEGIFLMGGATNPVFALTLGQMRGQRAGRSSPDAIWRPLFYGLDPRQRIEIEARRSDESSPRRLEIEALEVTSFADDGTAESGSGNGVAAVTEDFVIGGLRFRYSPSGGWLLTTTAVYDPRTGNIDAPAKERNDFVRTTFLSARIYPSLLRDAEQFSFLLRIKQEQDVIDAVKLIEPTVERIEVLSEPGGPSVYVDIGLPSLVPLAVAGEGFVRLFSIAVELTSSRRGVLLIDEIDNGLHYSVMPDLWKLLKVLCTKHEVQVIATSHNEELIRSALDAFADNPEFLGLFRIDKHHDRHAVAAYDAVAQEAVRQEHFEVRG